MLLELTDPQYKTPDGSALRVWRDAAKNNFLTEKLGRPMYDEVIYVEVISPGSRDSTPVFEVVRKYADEMNQPELSYGMNYRQFKEYIDSFMKDEEVNANLVGTPITQWKEVNRTMAMQLRSANIFTVDALAELPDTKLTVVGPDGRTWREKARAYIAAARDTGYATKLAADLDRANEELRLRDEQVRALATRIEELEKSAGERNTSGKAKIIDDII